MALCNNLIPITRIAGIVGKELSDPAFVESGIARFYEIDIMRKTEFYISTSLRPGGTISIAPLPGKITVAKIWGTQ